MVYAGIYKSIPEKYFNLFFKYNKMLDWVDYYHLDDNIEPETVGDGNGRKYSAGGLS